MFGNFFRKLDDLDRVIKHLMDQHTESLETNVEAHKKLMTACGSSQHKMAAARHEAHLRVVK